MKLIVIGPKDFTTDFTREQIDLLVDMGLIKPFHEDDDDTEDCRVWLGIAMKNVEG